MSERKSYRVVNAAFGCGAADDSSWINIFADRVSEGLKEVLQEDMDWTTSAPILERLNRLQEIEQSRSDGNGSVRQFRKVS